MPALPQQGEVQDPVSDQVYNWIRTTTTKMLKIGAGLREFLRYTEKIVFSKEPVHTPDPKFVEELARMIEALEKKAIE
jgi:hypothetical protein